MNFVESLNMFGVDAKEIPCIKGNGAPTTETVGEIGLLYLDTETGALYKCTKIEGKINTDDDGSDGGGSSYTRQYIWKGADGQSIFYTPVELPIADESAGAVSIIAIEDIYTNGRQPHKGDLVLSSNGVLGYMSSVGAEFVNISTIIDLLPRSGGTLSGKLSVNGLAEIDTSGYITAQWYRMRADNSLSRTPEQGVCVKDNGWMYTRTLAQFREDISTAPDANQDPHQFLLRNSKISLTDNVAVDEGEICWVCK